MLRFRQKPLPLEAEKFLVEFGAGKTKNTANLYRAALHHFYRFLTQSRLDLAEIKIHQINEKLHANYSRQIASKGLHCHERV